MQPWRGPQLSKAAPQPWQLGLRESQPARVATASSLPSRTSPAQDQASLLLEDGGPSYSLHILFLPSPFISSIHSSTENPVHASLTWGQKKRDIISFMILKTFNIIFVCVRVCVFTNIISPTRL